MDGNNLNSNGSFEPNNGMHPAGPPQQPQEKGLNIASLVLGIISLISFCLFYLSLPLGIIGLILGILGHKKNPEGMAKAGIILSIIGIVFSLGLLILTIIGFVVMDSMDMGTMFLY